MSRRPPLWKPISIGIVAGFIAGLMGVGGGVLMVPAMVWVLGMSQHKAHGTSLANMVPLAVAGASTYAFSGSINWVIAATLVPGGMLGAVLGARLCGRVPEHRLKMVFAAFVALTGLRMLIGGILADQDVHVALTGLPAACAGLATGLFSGFLAGLLGVGGGIVMVPVMSLILGLTQQTAQGTSLVAIVPTAVSGARTHHKLGNLDLNAAFGLALGGVPGSVFGGRVANAIDASTLTSIFGAFLITMATLMFVQARQRAIKTHENEAAVSTGR